MKQICNVLRTCAGNAGVGADIIRPRNAHRSGNSRAGNTRPYTRTPVTRVASEPPRAGSAWAHLLTLLLLLTLLPAPAGAAENVTINVYNWGQYISDGSDGTPRSPRPRASRSTI